MMGSAAIMTIKERIELASGPEYHALDDAERETEILLSAVVSVEDCLPVGAGETIIGAIRGILTSIQEFKNVCGSRHIRGRPQIPIQEEQLEFLLELHLSSSELARFFCVSTQTITRRIIQYGLDEMTSYSDLPNEALGEITMHFVGTHPNSGGRSLAGFLRGMRLKVQRKNVRESWERMDPSGVIAKFVRFFTDVCTMSICRIACAILMAITS